MIKLITSLRLCCLQRRALQLTVLKLNSYFKHCYSNSLKAITISFYHQCKVHSTKKWFCVFIKYKIEKTASSTLYLIFISTFLVGLDVGFVLTSMLSLFVQFHIFCVLFSSIWEHHVGELKVNGYCFTPRPIHKIYLPRYTRSVGYYILNPFRRCSVLNKHFI